MYTNTSFIKGFKTIKDDLNRLLRDVDDDLFVSLPADGGWCIGEVISHINKTTEVYLKQMEGGLNQPSDTFAKGAGTYSLPWTMRMFVKVVSPDFKPKAKTFPVFSPEQKADLNRDQLIDHFNRNMDRFIAIAEQSDSEDLNLDKIKVKNPVVKFFSMSLSACLAIHEAHTRRHLEQIKRLIPA